MLSTLPTFPVLLETLRRLTRRVSQRAQRRYAPPSTRAFRLIALLTTLSFCYVLAGCGSATTGPHTTSGHSYAGTWEGVTVTLTKLSASAQDLTGAARQGQLRNFQTDDQTYACLKGLNLDVYSEPAQFPKDYLVYGRCQGNAPGATAAGAIGLWTFPIPAPSPYSYTVQWQGQRVALTKAPGTALPPNSTLLGQATGFSTTDPAFACFEGATAKVFSAPADFPGKYVVFGRCPQHTPGLWYFAPSYSYSANWDGQRVLLMPLLAAEGPPPDGQPQGQLTDFQTDDPNYVCLSSGVLSVYSDPQGAPGVYVVYAGCPGGISGAWTFHVKVPPLNHYYRATWNGSVVQLTLLDSASVPADAAPLGQQVTNFQTDDSTYACFKGGSLNVWTAQELPTAYLVYDTCGGAGVFGAWTFPRQAT